MSLLVDAILIVVGVCMMRWSRRRGRERNHTQITRLTSDNQQLSAQNTHGLNDRRALVAKMVLMEQNRVLDQAVAEEAMRREMKAKKALKVILQQHHCTQAQIDHVLEGVDSVEIGDL